ncbi:MAG TPA: thioredoxin-disulfide reductase [Bacteroidetes bacterium]|nr:thioredoxin-disulfide reductase [Bacteroidota bacterium]
MEKVKCTIIGSGPAGYTAAIYAARAGLNPVVYAGPEPGGQLMLTTDVENFPGYPDAVQGPQMMEDFKKQAENVGAEVRHEVITKVDLSGDIHHITTEMGHEIESETVIVATGASAKWLGLESEQRLMNKGVSACAVCDGFFFRDQVVALVGGGDTAAEEALYLSKIVKKVYMIVRRDELRASKIMQKRVIESDKIEIVWNTQIKEILGDQFVEGVKLINTKENTEKEIELAAVFVAIGHKPNTDIFKDYLDMDEQGYLITEKSSMKTNVEGVFACGDVQDKVYRQAVTAAGTGCMAALDAERYLAEKGA